MPTATWGTVNHTGYYLGPWPASPNNWVQTAGYSFPTARLDLNGNRPIYIGQIRPGYWSGAYSDSVIIYGGNTYGSWTLLGSSGGTCTFRQRFTGGGTMYYGREMGNGFTVTNGRTSTVLTNGGLVGSMDWGQVSTAPQSLSVTRGTGPGQLNVVFAGPADNGGLGVIDYTIQTATSSGGPWTTRATTTTGTNVITLPFGSYFVRVYATNAAGNSQAAVTGSAVLTGGGGQRATSGSATTPLSIARRYNGTAWVDLALRRRYTGSAWVDVTN